eukprot:TRINITY_DN5087_c0_g1_i3.p1 TRINITY_DN5087_c0_g1~~TRINITY_DN5087_c0_g1_i3.p1  ORF type:complete len:344 (-),score=33.03 TRINITY_DN5087_c0_g1_i3:1087-2037(-)
MTEFQYPITAYTLCQNDDGEWRLDNTLDYKCNPMDFNVSLSRDLTIKETAVRIQNAFPGFTFKVHALEIDDILIDIEGEKNLGYYVFEKEQGEIEISAFGVDDSLKRGIGGGPPPVLFADISKHENMQVRSIENVDKLYKDMKTGLAIRAFCNNQNCTMNGQYVLHKVRFQTSRTATFDLLKDKVSCGVCKCPSELESPVMYNCEYKYKGEMALTQETKKSKDWRTVPQGNIAFVEMDKEHPQLDDRVTWSSLLIYVKVLDDLTCKSCKQFLDEQEPYMVKKAKCGHRYHQECFGYLKRRGKCVVKGCNAKLEVAQ